MNIQIKPATLQNPSIYKADGEDYQPLASEFETETKLRWAPEGEIRDTLIQLDPIFGVRWDYGWRPHIGLNGDVLMFDGTILFNDRASRLQVGENPKLVWRP